MAFTLTHAHALAILSPCAKGDWSLLTAAIDPDVRWWINSDTSNVQTKAGIYNLAQWIAIVRLPLFEKLVDEYLSMTTENLFVVGNSAIAECSGFAKLKDGREYKNRYAWFLVFDKESGLIKEIREYMDTAAVGEVFSD